MKSLTQIETIEEFQDEQPHLYRLLKTGGATDEQIMADIKTSKNDHQKLDNSKVYLLDTIRDKAGMAEPFPGVKFTPEQVEQADRLEIYASRFTPDKKPDYCLYRLVSKTEALISEIRRNGY